MDRVYEPEIVADDDRRASAHDQIEKIGWLMDNSIPIGGKFSIGLDPIIGLVPGVGDLITGLISTYLIVLAHRAGVPKPTLVRMVANVGIDSVVGTVPFFGDLFDFAFKSNKRNMELYRASMAGLHKPHQDYLFLALLVFLLAILISLPILLIVFLARYTFPAIY